MKDIEFTLFEKSGVYCIFNTITGKKYIGSSVNIYNRMHEHFHLLNKGEAHNPNLQKEWNENGKDAFKFQVLEYCQKDKLLDREQYYIDFMLPEYNCGQARNAFINKPMSDETKQRISETLKQKYASGELIGKYYGSSMFHCYLYDILNWKLVKEFYTLNEAMFFVYGNQAKVHNYGTYYALKALMKNQYICTSDKFENELDLKNYAYEKYGKLRKSKKWLKTVDINGKVMYFFMKKDCCNYNNINAAEFDKCALKNIPFPNGTKLFLLSEYEKLKE